jgi:tetratricopeptide (TPR) repeat protein
MLRRVDSSSFIVAAVTALAMSSFVSSLSAQGGILPVAPALPAAMPPRPAMRAFADTNDALDYYGTAKVAQGDQQRAAYWWAHRLAPESAIFAVSALQYAMTGKDAQQFLDRYFFGPHLSKEERSRQEEAFLVGAYIRDPFAYDPSPAGCTAPSSFTLQPDLNAGALFVYYGCFPKAIARWESFLREHPKAWKVRVDLAHVFAYDSQYDSAAAECQAALADLKQRQKERVGVKLEVTESIPMLEYMSGRAEEMAGKPELARAAYQRALEEDLGFYGAHVALAKMAFAGHDTTTALNELDLAVRISGTEGFVRQLYGVALLNARRLPDAEAQLRKAIELEPYYHNSYYNLAVALDREGKAAEAIVMYRKAKAMLPARRAPELGPLINARLDELATAPAIAQKDSTAHPTPE